MIETREHTAWTQKLAVDVQNDIKFKYMKSQHSTKETAFRKSFVAPKQSFTERSTSVTNKSSTT